MYKGNGAEKQTNYCYRIGYRWVTIMVISYDEPLRVVSPIIITIEPKGKWEGAHLLSVSFQISLFVVSAEIW